MPETNLNYPIPHSQTSTRPQRFLAACRRQPVDATPVWLMRQAGRYMVEYRTLRQRYTILEIIKTPELACAVTMQPIDAFDLDAAIIFADILPPLEGMGLSLEFVKGEGPLIHNPVRTPADVAALTVRPPQEALWFTLDAIGLARKELDNRGLPLIGFSGAPFTLAAYAVEGGGSKNHVRVKSLMMSDPAAWRQLMEKLSQVVGDYLLAQAQAGAQVLQVFDSWVGQLSPDDYRTHVLPYSRRAIEIARAAGVPIIHFGTDTAGLLPLILKELDDISWKIGSTQISVRNLIEGTVTAVLVLMLVLWLSAALESRLLKGATDNISIRKMAANALRALLLFVGLMFALSAAGIDLTALGVLGGALGVGIGFGLQKLAANYISGFVILAERSMRIGDMVKVDTFEGRITDITTRYTVIRALNGRESIVPNEMMITQRVENSSLADPKVALTTMVQVAYGTDLDALMPELSAAVAAVPRVLDEPMPAVQLSNFAADGLELTIAFWIGDPDKGQGNVRSEVNLALLRKLTQAGVEIPFPQRVLHQAAGAVLEAARPASTPPTPATGPTPAP